MVVVFITITKVWSISTFKSYRLLKSWQAQIGVFMTPPGAGNSWNNLQTVSGRNMNYLCIFTLYLFKTELLRLDRNRPLFHEGNCVKVLVTQLCSTLPPWTVTCQAPLSMEFSRQEYLSRLPFPPPRDLPDPEIKPAILQVSHIAGRFFTIWATGKAFLIPYWPFLNQGWRNVWSLSSS